MELNSINGILIHTVKVPSFSQSLHLYLNLIRLWLLEFIEILVSAPVHWVKGDLEICAKAGPDCSKPLEVSFVTQTLARCILGGKSHDEIVFLETKLD